MKLTRHILTSVLLMLLTAVQSAYANGAGPYMRLEQTQVGLIPASTQVSVTLRQSALGTPVSGFQAFLEFDNTKLLYTGGSYTFNPFGFVLSPISGPSITASNTSGLIDLGAIVTPGVQAPTTNDALLVTLSFFTLDDLCVLPVEFRNNVPPTRWTTSGGGEILGTLIDPVDIGPPAPRLVIEHGPLNAASEYDAILSQRDLCDTLAVGFQAFLEFDNAKVELLAGTYAAGPYELVLQPINPVLISNANASGLFDLGAITVGPGTSSDATLATLQFRVIGDCIDPLEFRANNPPTRMTEAGGGEILPQLDVLGPSPVIAAPADVVVDVDASGCPGVLTALQIGTPTALTPCGGTPIVSSSRSDGKPGLTDPFDDADSPITITWTVLDGPLLAQDTQTITVNVLNAGCDADVDGNGDVDIDDLVSVILAWGTDDCAADSDDNGTVDVDDLVAIILGFGACP